MKPKIFTYDMYDGKEIFFGIAALMYLLNILRSV